MNPLTLTPVSYTIGTQWIPQSGSTLGWQSNAATTLNATLSFMIPSGRGDLFREPTLLITPGIPSGSSLSGPGPYTALFPAAQHATNGILGAAYRSFTGIPMGIVPMAFTASLPREASLLAFPPRQPMASSLPDTSGILPVARPGSPLPASSSVSNIRMRG